MRRLPFRLFRVFLGFLLSGGDNGRFTLKPMPHVHRLMAKNLIVTIEHPGGCSLYRRCADRGAADGGAKGRYRNVKRSLAKVRVRHWSAEISRYTILL